MAAIRIQEAASHRLDDIYRYTRDQALTEATRIAPLQTAGFNAYIARLRAETKEEPTT